ncbi:MAG: NAD(P)H-dependent oxidoreductase [Dehalococcoidia bacterium]|nr:NAD(P)H-dependent oxidoreductase [Dehalococcoidia bacterium]
MKTLVVYYSRSGNTRKLAEEIGAALKADVEELQDGKDRKGPVAFILAGREAMHKTLVELQPLAHDPAAYDAVVVGSPVWASTVCSPVRTFLTKNRTQLKKVAWFCTSGGEDPAGAEKTFAAMTEASELTPAATLGVGRVSMKKDHSAQLAAFAASIGSHR